MKTFFSIALIFFLTIILLFASCDINDEDSKTTESIKSEVSENVSDFSNDSTESKDDFSEESSLPEESDEPLYTDMLFKEITYIKCCDYSDEPNYESIYKFDINGTLVFSTNQLEGFYQSHTTYFVRMYEDNYEIHIYENLDSDSSKVLFSVDADNNITDEYLSTALFIDKNEFDKIYKFHNDWNERVYNSFNY